MSTGSDLDRVLGVLATRGTQDGAHALQVVASLDHEISMDDVGKTWKSQHTLRMLSRAPSRMA